MAQDTRKDPRAKVLTMTVRYKSATLDEFIEHHSHDVSRGGMFIKTSSPFPPGTLLKFEVKIAEDQKVMQGVGRVVWKRESSEASGDEHPIGMGVKFIKIDDDSKQLIDQLVTSRGDGSSAYDEGQEVAGTPSGKPSAPSPSSKPPEQPAAAKKLSDPIRKATMIGLGAIGASQPPEASNEEPGKKEEPGKEKSREEKKEETEKKPEPAQKADSFFPKTESEQEMPPPEDRTVMKQAAELLQDALREAGGSMDEVGESKKPEPGKKEEPGKEKTPEKKPEPGKEKTSGKKAEKSPAGKTQARETEKKEKTSGKKPERKPAAVVRPEPAQPEGGGGGKIIWLLLAVLIAVTALFFLMRSKPAPTEPTAEPSTLMPATPMPTETASAAEQTNAAATGSADAAATDAQAEPAASASTSTSATAAPTLHRSHTSAKPKPYATHAKPKPYRPKRHARPEHHAKPKPTAKPTKAAPPKPTATAKPAPKPKSPPAKSDNPY